MASLQQWWVVLIGIVTVQTVLLFKLLTNQSSLELLIPILVITILMSLMLRIQDVTKISFDQNGISADLSNIRADLNKTQDQLDKAQKAIEETKQRIDKLFLLSMSKVMVENLIRLLRHDFWNFQKSEGLERELQYLRMIDYITMKNGHHLREIPIDGANLNLANYIEVTKIGKEFIELREVAEKEKQESVDL